MLPKARTEKLLVTDLDNEVVVYDVVAQRAHNLNPTAAFVWRHANGETTVRDMAGALAQELDLPEDENLVWLALGRLGDAGLLTEPVPSRKGVTRRQVMKKLAAAGVAMVPLVSSIAAPTPAMGQSVSNGGNGVVDRQCGGQPDGTACDNGNVCTIDQCVGGVCVYVGSISNCA